MSVSLQVEFDNGALQASLFGDHGVLTEFLESYARAVVNQAVANVGAMRAVRTGNLRRSIHSEPIQITNGRAEIGIVADAHYASFVHEGTAPHTIRPVNAKALRFTVGKKVVFAASVNHPGTKARPFLRMAAEEVASRMLT